MKKTSGFLFASLLVALLTACNPSKNPQPLIDRMDAPPQEEPSASPQVYQNPEDAFQFAYPGQYNYERNAKPFSLVFTEKGSENSDGLQNFILGVESGTDKNRMNFYLDSDPVGIKTIAGFTANKFVLDKGYCDGPACGPPVTAFLFYDESTLSTYTFAFYNQFNAQDMEQILSTFTLIKKEKSEQEITPIKGLMETKNYENKEKGVSFSYPIAYRPESSAEKNTSLLFSDENGKSAFWIQEKSLETIKNPGESDEQAYERNAYYLDNSPVGKQTIGGLEAMKFVLESSEPNCTGPDCMPFTTAFMMQDKTRGRMLYLVFRERSEEEINTVISSFKLI